MPFDLKSYARAGAEARLREIQTELDEIREYFPELQRRGARPRNGSPATSPQRTRRMSAAQRTAVSERMRRYWAQRRAAKK